MEQDWISLIPRITALIAVVGSVLFLLALIFLRIGRKGAYWRRRREAARRGGRLLIVSVGLWVIAALMGVSLLAATFVRSERTAREADDLYGIVLVTPTGQTGLSATLSADISTPTPPPPTATTVTVIPNFTPPFDEISP